MDNAADTPDDRTADISAAYPTYAMDYRLAKGILTGAEQASTDDLRNAFVRYRALFDEILGGQNEKFKRVA